MSHVPKFVDVAGRGWVGVTLRYTFRTSGPALRASLQISRRKLRTMNNLISPGVLGSSEILRRAARTPRRVRYECVARISRKGIFNARVPHPSPVDMYPKFRTVAITHRRKYACEAKTRGNARGTVGRPAVHAVLFCTLHNHAIINTDHSWRDRRENDLSTRNDARGIPR